MSTLNNRDTLRHYAGNLWLTKPGLSKLPQGIAVCIQKGEDFAAVEYLLLDADGVYSRGGKPLGRWEDDGLRRFLRRLAGAELEGSQTTLQTAWQVYTDTQSLPQTAKALGVSLHRARR